MAELEALLQERDAIKNIDMSIEERLNLLGSINRLIANAQKHTKNNVVTVITVSESNSINNTNQSN